MTRSTTHPDTVTAMPDPTSEAAYFASVWKLSNPQMRKLEEAFRTFFDAGRDEPRSAYEAVRALIKPDTILSASEIHLDQYPRKAIFNALTHLARQGYLVRIGYGRYQSPPAGPLSTAQKIASDLREGTFKGAEPTP